MRNYENNARLPESEFTATVWDRFGVTADWLIFGKEDGEKEEKLATVASFSPDSSLVEQLLHLHEEADIMDSFAERLRKLRGTTSTAEFAKKLGISHGALNSLDIDPNWLLFGTAEGPSNQVIPTGGGNIESNSLQHVDITTSKQNKRPNVGGFPPPSENADTIRHFQALVQSQQSQITALNSENRLLLREIAELREERGASRVEREFLRKRIARLEEELARERAREPTPRPRKGYAADSPAPELRDSSESHWPHSPLGDRGAGNIQEIPGGTENNK